jgi:hypothetical protein
MKKITLLIVILLSPGVYASPSRELPTDYLDLGKLYISRLSQNFSFWESNLEIRSFARLKA